VGTAPATATRRLAAVARKRGVRLLREPATGAWFAASAAEPGMVHALSVLSCACRGFARRGRCEHHRVLFEHLGWLPDLGDDGLAAD
jgi:hypothetical protein